MAQQVDIQIRLWPWSVAQEELVTPHGDTLSFPYYGSPTFVAAERSTFMLPRRNEQFIPHGTVFATRQGKYRLYEVPHGVLASKEKSSASAVRQDLTIFSDSRMQEVTLDTEFAMPQWEEKNPSELANTVKAWSQFFDDCIDARKMEGSENRLPWQNIKEYLEKASGETSEPRMALIVHIAQKMRNHLAQTVRMARKILLRERNILPVERITETDTACLRWYIRQPGENMAQKAAVNRQSLMAISRKESFDTLENRVLKDFLFRCKMVAQKYITTEVGKQFQDSRKGRDVRQFQSICADLLSDRNLLDVAQLHSRVRPNYVLQNDARYREVWRNYQRLLRQEDEEDRSWDWQSRTWADIVRLLTGAALASMEKQRSRGEMPFAKPLLQASMYIRKEQDIGSRVLPGCEPGPFAITPKNTKGAEWILEIVHSKEADAHAATQDLAEIGGHLYLVLERIGKRERRIIIIWAVHTASSTARTSRDWWNEVSRSAQSSLAFHADSLSRYQTNFPKLSGMVIASALKSQKVNLHLASSDAPSVIEVPADPKQWANELENMAILLQDRIEAAIQ